MTKALIDTNVIIDIALKRQPFYQDAVNVFKQISEQKLLGYISATIVTDVFYLLRKASGQEKALAFLHELITIVDVIGVDKRTIINALSLNWADFEDAVQAQTAIENELDVIITRNTKDYQPLSKIQIVSPSNYSGLTKLV
ncbi:PIN domain-containing protein [Bacteroidia bacterium]|nr:PIN domain-containing protein [Bacteroidia bacterium]